MYNVEFVMVKSQVELTEQAAYRPIGTVCYTPGGTYAWQLDQDREWQACHAFGFNCSAESPSAGSVWNPKVIKVGEEGNNAQIYDITQSTLEFTVHADLDSIEADEDSKKMLNIAVGTDVQDISRITVNGSPLTTAQLEASADLPGGYFLWPIDGVATSGTAVTLAIKAEYCPDLTITIATANVDVPGISVEVTASLADDATEAHPGDTITYSAVVTNTGEAALTNVEIEDSLVELSEEAFSLAVEGTETITYTYTVTDEDLEVGEVTNTATVTAECSGWDDLTAFDSCTVTVTEAPPAEDDSGSGGDDSGSGGES